MCDCFQRIFGVTWSPASASGAAEEPSESHASRSEPCPIKVKEKFGPPKPKSPPASRPHPTPEELKDSERTAQKERLHEELKKVLLLKVQRESAERPDAEMETQITEEKLRLSEMVEVIVETEAQAGMSGIAISGGGQEGLFISELLKDSPAAKTLPLLEGDQIVSARIFFENVRYEDALKILQYAERYKVSYCLKRTVPSADVSVSAASGSVEVKGPKAKMPKMTVKSLTPVKKKKKKASGEGKVSEEASVEAVRGSEVSAGSMEIPPVGVEFSFPKFSKFLKTKGVAEAGAVSKAAEVTPKVSDREQKWAKMKFPRLRVKEAAAAGGLSVTAPEGKAELAKGSPETKEKAATKFGISVPKMKKPKVDAAAPKPEVEVSLPKLEIEAKAPEIELDLPLLTTKAETQEISSKEGIKMAALGASAKIPDVEIKVPTAHVEADVQESKITMPQVPKVGICSPSLDRESDIAVQVDGRPKTEIKLPTLEVAPPKLDVDLSLRKAEADVEVEALDVTGKGLQFKLPTFGVSSKAPEAELEVTGRKFKKETEVKEEKFKMPSVKSPEIGISLPKGKREGDSPDGKQKISMKLPSLDVSVPKVDFDIALPKGKMDAEISGGIAVPDVALKMPKMSPPKPGMKVKEAYADSHKINATVPQLDLKTGKAEAESSVSIPDVTLKMPKISLPKLGMKEDAQETKVEAKMEKLEGEWHDFKISGPKIKLPSVGLSLSKEKLDVSVEEHGMAETDGKIGFPSVKVPSLDISLPKVSGIQPGKPEATVPSTKVDAKAPYVEGSGGLDLKLKMPSVSLPTFDISAKAEKPQVSPPKLGIHAPRAESKVKGEDLVGKGDKITLPKLDISVPKMKPAELHVTPQKPDLEVSIEKPKIELKLPKVGSDAIAFHGDSKVGFGSIKLPSLELDAPKMDVDLNFPKAKTDGSEPLIEGPEGKIQMPKMSLPKFGDVAKDVAVEINVPRIAGEVSVPHVGSEIKKPQFEEGEGGGRITLPGVELGLGKSDKTTDVELKEKADVKPPKVKPEKPQEAGVELPSVKFPSVALTAPKVPDVDIDAGLPKVSLEGPSMEDAAVEASAKAPRFSLRKLGFSGPKLKKGGEGETKASHEEGEAEVTVKSPKMKMPKFGITFPKSKHEASADVSKSTLEKDVKAKKGKADMSAGQIETSSEGKAKLPLAKLPSVDISAPKLEVDIAIPKGGSSDATDRPSDINIDIPEVKMSLPKFSMPKFGSKTKESEEDAKLHGKISTKKSAGGTDTSSDGGSSDGKGKMKMPTIKMPSFGISKKEVEVSDVKVEVGPPEVKVKKTKISAKETKVEVDDQETNGKTSFIKMPTFKMSPPKVKAPEVDLALEGSREDLRLPDVQVKVPQVELPSFGLKGEKSSDITVPRTEAKVSKALDSPDVGAIKMPSLEISGLQDVPSLQISVPCVKPELSVSSPKAEVDVSDSDIKGYDGDLKIPKLPSISVPNLQLDIALPKASLDSSLDQEAKRTLEKSDLRLKMPKVELPKFGETDAKIDIEGTKYKSVEVESKLKGPKIKMPHFDISLPKVRLDEEDIPFIEGDLKTHGVEVETSSTEGRFSLPSVELPKMSTPKIRAPELELGVNLSKDELRAGEGSKTQGVELAGPEVGLSDLKFKMPKVKLPKFGGHSAGGDDEETAKVDVKSQKTEEGRAGLQITMPKLQMASLKGKGGGDVSVEAEGGHKKAAKEDGKVSDHEDSEYSRMFKIKMPSFGMTREAEHAAEGGDAKFKMPQISIPDVGFSGREGPEASLEGGRGKADVGADSKIKGAKSSSLEDLEIDLSLKMPKMKMPTIGRKTDDDMNVALEEDSEGKKSLFRMPDVEISTPKMKAHAEYDVGGAKLEDSLSKEMEMELISTRKGSMTKEESKDPSAEESGRKYKVKLPKFAISLPKPVPGDVEFSTPKLKSNVKESESSAKTASSGHESDQEGKKSKRNIFSLGKSKERNAGLLTADADTAVEAEGPEVKIKLPKIKMKPNFGKSKTKGAEVNGEFEASASGETEAETSADGKFSKIKFPKLGFSSRAGEEDTRVNGAGASGHVNGEHEGSAQNGSQEGGVVKIGKLKFPKVEFSSPYKAKEGDSEIHLKLVKADDPDSKEETHESSFTSKFKSFSGFKKKDKGEEQLLSSSSRTETATKENVGEGEAKTGRAKISLGFLSSKSKGEYTVDNSGIDKDSADAENKEKNRYKIPKLSLGPQSESEITTQAKEGAQDILTVSAPKVAFTTHHEERTVEEEKVAGGLLKITTTKQIKTETITEKTVSI
ncbi:periaxin [Spea bombifrons]|uniref:periaxin n=1 Tax=Spea bombifrons TaxID=233779 RepID=UPI00234AEB88|nr:periaxin [Spea bombifrons]